jgi:DNA modification methylase
MTDDDADDGAKTIESIADLTPDDLNANRGNERGRGLLEKSLGKFGAGRSILVDRNGKVIAGNKTVEAAAEMQFPTRVVRVHGTELVVVQRMDLDMDKDPEARELAIADNRVAQVDLEWDPAALSALAEAGVNLGDFFLEDELADILKIEPPEARPDVDDVPEERATDIQVGDMFALGAHRLICGDSADPAVVARLMGDDRAVLCATDPPYGVNYSGARYNPHAKPWQAIAGDALTGATLRRWLRDGITTWRKFCTDDAAFYFWTACMAEGAAMYEGIIDAGLHVQSQIIWVKNSFTLGQADYHWRHENAWYAFLKGAHHRWYGERDKSTVWEVSRVASASYEHPMQKPVELYAIPMRHHTRDGEICIDVFSGSGTSTIAAETMKRRMRAVELHPPFVQVTIDRWEKFTGLKATKIS